MGNGDPALILTQLTFGQPVTAGDQFGYAVSLSYLVGAASTIDAASL